MNDNQEKYMVRITGITLFLVACIFFGFGVPNVTVSDTISFPICPAPSEWTEREEGLFTREQFIPTCVVSPDSGKTYCGCSAGPIYFPSSINCPIDEPFCSLEVRDKPQFAGKP